jgi:hypothetical protein
MASVSIINSTTIRVVATAGSGDSEANAVELGDVLVSAGYATESLSDPDIISYTSALSGSRQTIEIGDGSTTTFVKNTKTFRHWGGGTPTNTTYTTIIRNFFIRDAGTLINGEARSVNSNTIYSNNKGRLISLNASSAEYFHDLHSILYAEDGGTYKGLGGELSCPNVDQFLTMAFFPGSTIEIQGKNKLHNIRVAGFCPTVVTFEGQLLLSGNSNFGISQNRNGTLAALINFPAANLSYNNIDFRESGGIGIPVLGTDQAGDPNYELVFKDCVFGGATLNARQTYPRNNTVLYIDNPTVFDFGAGDTEVPYGTYRAFEDSYERISLFLDFAGYINSSLLPIAKIFDVDGGSVYANGDSIIDTEIQSSGVLGAAVSGSTNAKDNRLSGEVILIRKVIESNSTNSFLTATTTNKYPYDLYFSSPFCFPQALELSFPSPGAKVRRTVSFVENGFITLPHDATHWAEIGVFTNISVSFATNTVAVSGSAGANSSGDDIQDAYDYQYYVQHAVTANRDKTPFLETSDGTNFSIANYDATGRIPVSGKNLTISGQLTTTIAGDYSGLPWAFGASSTVIVPDGASDWSGSTFVDGAAFEITDGGDAVVTVASAALATQLDADKVETSGTIAFVAPPTTVQVTVTGPTDYYVTVEQSGSRLNTSDTGLQSGVYSFETSATGSATVRVRRQGWQPFLTTVSLDGGTVAIAPRLSAKVDVVGANLYTGSTSTLCSIVIDASDAAHRIDIGDGTCNTQTIFDELEDASVSAAGMLVDNLVDYGFARIAGLPQAIGMPLSLKVRRASSGDSNAGIRGAIFHAADAPLDDVNGEVRFIERLGDWSDDELAQIRYALYMDGTRTAPTEVGPGRLWTESDISSLVATLASSGVFSTAALANAPAGGSGGDATEAKQDIIIATLGTDGDGLTSIPWNAAWDAEVQSEVLDGLAEHTAPTKAELDAAVSGLSTFDANNDFVLVGGYDTLQNPPSVSDIRAEIDSNSTQLAAIVAATNELQTDWANGGRLDTILDNVSTFDGNLSGIASQVWSYSGGDRTLSGSQATHLSSIPNIPKNPLLTTDSRLDFLDIAISSRSDFEATTDSVIVGDKTGFSLATAPPTALEISEAVWNEDDENRLVTIQAYSSGQAPDELVDLSITNTLVTTVDSVVDAIKVKTDQLNFASGDVIATLDGETVNTGLSLSTIESNIGLLLDRLNMTVGKTIVTSPTSINIGSGETVISVSVDEGTNTVTSTRTT